MSEAAEIAETLSLLAHDLKNPLAAVLTNLGFVGGFVDALDPDAPPDAHELEDVREATLDARLACEALQRFIGNLEVLSRDLRGAGASMPPEERAPLDLLALADEIVSRHRSAAAARRLELAVVGESRWARGDRDAILRAADNLLANAAQYAPSGTRVTVSVAQHGAEVSLTVLDEGPVVPEPLRDEAVSRSGQSRAKGDAGARYGRGLSLYAAAASARLGGGRLSVGGTNGKSAMGITLMRFDEGG